MTDEVERIRNEEHLRLLSIFYYVWAGLSALFGCIPIVHVIMGIVFLNAPAMQKGPNPPPPWFGWIFIGIGSFVILMMWSIALLSFFAGRNLAARKGYTLCMIAAALCCLSVPIGTALGIFTFIVLSRPTVKALFQPTA